MTVRILIGDALEQLKTLPAESVHCCVTSPPYYGLRCYGTDGQIGLEPTPEAHIAALVEVFREVRRVLRKDGVAFVNYGDCYASTVNGRSAEDTKEAGNDDRTFRDKPFSTVGGVYKPKDLLMMPSRVALALQADGWWLRSMMPWVKRAAMPESVTDRPATAVEYVFMLTKSARYFFDMEAVRQDGSGRGPQKSYHNPNNPKYNGVPHERWKDQFDGRFWGDSAGRNFRNSDLFYASLQPPHGLIYADDPLALDVNPAGFSDAHFATFPPKLIEPLIKAATSEKGCCAECGAPWVREVESQVTGSYGADYHGRDGLLRNDLAKHAGRVGEVKTKTLSWSPSCEHAANVHQCTILDPFGGAGTTGLVADRLGRDAILIELNPDYAAMARTRIDTDAATRGTGPQDVMRGDDLPLFTEAT